VGARDLPPITGDYDADRSRCAEVWTAAPPSRSPDDPARRLRVAFLRTHAGRLYDELTAGRTRQVRLEQLAYAAADEAPGLVPTREQVAPDAGRPLAEKAGVEIDQGVLVAHLLDDPAAGTHLCQTMLRATPAAAARLPDLEREGRLELAGATIERQGSASIVTLRNPRFLNAEDATTLEETEVAVDLALLDPATTTGVLRGGPVEHPRYGGERVLGSGINLTELYRGRIPFLWYLTRDLGYVSKLLRGVATDDTPDDRPAPGSVEKLWIAVVDRYAIGGHCQLLLAVDHTIAGDDAYLTLPARKEGIIPGAANLRLPRFVGDRLARQAILSGLRFVCDSAEGRLICDEVVPATALDDAVAARLAALGDSGLVSAVGNRRSFRVHQEPLDTFRRYMALYTYEQVFCHFSDALIANLERFWDARARAGRL
jgi:thioesterase DpgC